jgi:short-subunit dehydrogenase
MKSFKGKVAAITGAGSGIGRALALKLAAQGCHLALSGRTRSALAETAALVAKQKPKVKVTITVLDVADRAAMHAWADQVVADHGRCHLIINNAGVALSATIQGASYADLDWIVGINFWGVVHGTKAFLPHLKAAGEGHVVNISSIFGLISLPSQGAYNATKFAVRGFTEALRQELEIENSPVSATNVHPGGIKTNIAKSARMDKSAATIGGKDEAASRQLFERLISTTTAERAADLILRGVQKNARRVLIGPDAHAVDLMQRLLPTAYQKLIETATKLVSR